MSQSTVDKYRGREMAYKRQEVPVPRACPRGKMTAMAMVEFLRYLGTACVQHNISLVEVGRRRGWPDDVTLTILQGNATPTTGQLEAMSQEMGIPFQTLTGLLDKWAPVQSLCPVGLRRECLTSLVDDHEDRFGAKFACGPHIEGADPRRSRFPLVPLTD
jgi:hypothetical protein